MKKPTYYKPLVIEKKGDKYVIYYSEDNPFDVGYGYGANNTYARGNFAASDTVFWFKQKREWLAGFFEYIFKKVRL